MDKLFQSDFTYPNGFADLVRHAPSHQPPYPGMEETLKEAAAPGLAALKLSLLPPNPPDAESQSRKTSHSADEKFAELCHEFAGQPRLLALHGLIIAASRRAEPPPLAQSLFLKIWRDHSAFLLDHLDRRWQLSSLQTFRDLGETEAQRRSAAELTVFFALTKLYESERLYSGFKAKKPFSIETRASGGLPLKLKGYSLRAGDLDRNLLGHLWISAEEDPVLRPLACRLLTDLNRDKASLFRRLRLMRRARKRKHRP